MNNPPAFPGIEGVSGYGNQVPQLGPNGELIWVSYNSGMELRDWFAGIALQGALASCPEGIRYSKNSKLPIKDWAEWSYQCADAMLESRENKKP
jgi:hypothetical protein